MKSEAQENGKREEHRCVGTGRERARERGAKGGSCWTPCGSARVRSTLKGLWLASVSPRSSLPSPQPPLSPLPTSGASLPTPSERSSTTQLATLVASRRARAKLPTAGGHFTLPSPWTRQIVIRGPGIPGRATVVRPQRRLPSPLDLPLDND